MSTNLTEPRHATIPPDTAIVRRRPGAHPSLLISRLPYVGGLDGLRALAVAAVIVYHGNHRWLPGGYLGVEVFFVISGYLITLLLIGEHERKGSIALGQFWRRRFRRLLPALYLTLALVTIYLAIFWRSAQGRVRGDIVAGVTYTSNWFQILVGQSYTAVESFVPLRHLWSLAVEEQFYLVWPLVMVLLVRVGRKRLPTVGVWLIGISVAIAVGTAVLFANGDIEASCPPGGGHGYVTAFDRCINVNETLYLGSISRAGGLMLGAGMAMLWRPMAIMRGPIRNRGRRLDGLAVLAFGLLGLLVARMWLSDIGRGFGVRYNPWLFRGGFLLTGVATAVVIAAVTHPRSWTNRVMALAPLRWVGTRSYGLYLFHWPVFQVMRRGEAPELPWTKFLVAVAITMAIAEFSFRYVEMPVRQGRLSEWLRGQRRPRTARARQRMRVTVGTIGVASLLAVGAGISVGIADNECIGGQECDNEAGVAAINAGAGTPAATPSGAPATEQTGPVGQGTASGGTAELGSTVGTDSSGEATPATSPSGAVPVTAAITPSVAGSPSLGSSPAAVTPGTATPAVAPAPAATNQPKPLAIGESVMLGAAPNLEAAGIRVDATISRQAPAVADLLAKVGSMGGIPPTVIIQIGTNGTVSQNTLDRIMEQMPARLVPHVFFLTVKAPKPWIAENNRLIRALPERYPNVTVIDWETKGATIDGELSRTDGKVHLRTPAAKTFYTAMIVDAVSAGG